MGDSSYGSALDTAYRPSVGHERRLPFKVGVYRVVRRIGQGGMGTVYEAVHEPLNRTVALKLLSPALVSDPKAVVRFFREMEAMGGLKHPNIVEAYDAGSIDGQAFLAMELVDGADLERIARQVGPMGVADVCEIGRQVALALDHAHQHGLVHRDVKPSNLLLDPQGQVKLADLGLVRWMNIEGSTSSAGQILGTVDYLSPEQAEGGRAVDPRSDLYSLGCTLYRLLAGQPPFTGDKYVAAAHKIHAHLYDPIVPLSVLRPEISQATVDLVHKLLEKDPANRFQNARDVAGLLEKLCAGEQLTATGSLPRMYLGASAPISQSQRDTPHGIPGDTPLDTRTASAPLVGARRRNAAWIGLGGLCGAIVVLAVVLRMNPGKSSADAALPPDARPAAAPAQQPAAALVQQPAAVPDEGSRTWVGLFGDSIHKLRWPQHDDRSTYSIQRPGDKLEMNTEGVALLSLGIAPPTFDFNVEISRQDWAFAQVGLFFGARDATTDGREAIRTQTIRVREILDQAQRKWHVERDVRSYFRASPDHVAHQRCAEEIPTPKFPVKIHIQVSNGRLAVLEVDGHPIRTLIEANAKIDPVDDGGEWGLLSNGGVSWFNRPVFSKRVNNNGEK